MIAYEPRFWLFASDAARLAMIGAALVLVAVAMALMERRRMRHARLDRTGWVPWTSLFMLFALGGGALLAVSLPAAIAG